MYFGFPIFYFFCSGYLVSDSLAYEVKVKVIEDNGEVKEWSYTQDLHDKHSLQKRSIPEVKEATNGGGRVGCVEVPPDGSSTGHVDTAVVAMLGSTVLLPCKICGKSELESHKAKVWYRLEAARSSHHDTHTYWQPREVSLDMNDDPSRNRVYHMPDHTLVIRNFYKGDTGTYFCQDYDPRSSDLAVKHLAFKAPKMNMTSAAAMVLIWKHVVLDSGLQFMYHVDLELPVRFHFVTENGKAFTKPEKPKIKNKDNWMVHTVWSPWGPCNTCGEMGERRRSGQCRVKMVDKSLPVSPPLMEATLRLYPDGAPCHSTLFLHFTAIWGQKQELEIGYCQHNCTGPRVNADTEAGKVEGPKDLDGILPELQLEQGIKATAHKRGGENIIIRCPGANVTDGVAWRNNSVLMLSSALHQSTMGRVNISVSHELSFHTLQLSDAGTYSCYYGNQKRATVTLIVDEPLEQDSGIWMSVLLGSYVLDAVVFIFLLIIKHLHRIRQKKGKKRKKQKI